MIAQLAASAFSMIRSAVAAGTKLEVYADETRPFLQGARLTAWELDRLGIDHTLVVHFDQARSLEPAAGVVA